MKISYYLYHIQIASPDITKCFKSDLDLKSLFASTSCSSSLTLWRQLKICMWLKLNANMG